MAATPLDAADLSALARMGCATVYEAAGREGLVDLPFLQLHSGTTIAGPARTVRCGQGDNLMVHAAIPALEPGEVLVVAMPQPRPVALVGDLLVTQMAARGAAGLVLNGAVRDVATLRAMELPVWAPFVRVRGATRAAVGAVGDPVEIGGTTVATGDVVVADADGVVVVGAARVGEVRRRAAAREEQEQDKRAQFQRGVTSFDLYGLDAAHPALGAPDATDGGDA